MATGRLVLPWLLMIVVLVAVGCPSRSYSLPSDWPIAQLTLPNGAQMTRGVIAPHRTGLWSGDKSWLVFFDCDDDYEAVAGHVESCLGPLGYLEYWLVNPRIGSSQKLFRHYYSPDLLTEVSLSLGVGSQANVGQGLQSDYTLSITVRETPPTPVQHGNRRSSTGVESHLEPIQP